MTGSSVDLSDLDLGSPDQESVSGDNNDTGKLKAQLEEHFSASLDETSQVASSDVVEDEDEFQAEALPIPITLRPFNQNDPGYVQRNGNNCVGSISLYCKHCVFCTAFNTNLNPYGDLPGVKRKEVRKCWPGHKNYNGAQCPAQFIEIVVTGHIDTAIRKFQSMFNGSNPSPNAQMMNLQSLMTYMDQEQMTERDKATIMEALGIRIG